MEEPLYTSIMESLTRGLNYSKSFRLIFKGDNDGEVVTPHECVKND